MDFSNGNGNGFHGSNGFPRPMLARMLGQADAQIPSRLPATVQSTVVPPLIPFVTWPLVAGVGLLAGGFAVKNKDMKTALFGLGSTLAGVSTVALFAKL
jgi:hypothetical protein